jgi:hypothetical protein
MKSSYWRKSSRVWKRRFLNSFLTLNLSPAKASWVYLWYLTCIGWKL